MKQFLLSVSLLIGAAINAQDCSELFISEYVEGWSTNKAIEIYNPTDQAIDLSDYLLQRYSNGSTSASAQNSVQLNGTIQPFDVYVAVLEKLDENGTGQESPVWDSLQARADGFYCPDYDVSNTLYFNGNDAMILSKGSMNDLGEAVIIDAFGKVGEDPDNGECDTDEYSTCGWTTEAPYIAPAGVVVTTDHSLIRKPSIKDGRDDLADIFGSAFNPLAQWDSIPPVIVMLDANGDTVFQQDGVTPRIEGNWKSLGSHECECNALSIDSEKVIRISIYPNPSENGEFTVSTEQGIEQIDVLNTLGQNVYNVKTSGVSSTINVGNKTGVYFVKIITEDGQSSSRKVIVK